MTRTSDSLMSSGRPSRAVSKQTAVQRVLLGLLSFLLVWISLLADRRPTGQRLRKRAGP